MKNSQFFLLLAALSAPAFATAGTPLQQYDVMRQAFYQFDRHAYKSFTCKVNVSALDAWLNPIRQFVASHADSLHINEDMKSYSLTVDRDTGLSIYSPTFDVAMVSDQGVTDPAQVQQA